MNTIKPVLVIRFVAFLGVITIVSLCDCHSASAQGIVVGGRGQFAPSPTLSPYLDLLRFNGGVLPNYQQFVRPQIRLRETLVQQSTTIQQQQRTIRSMQSRVATPNRQNATTGVHAGFLQYSTFYPSLQR
ncbi:hypothetical protein [Novipirellula aureliae]|nr:hypothetical protein [Novipirellula aureliae]